METTVYFVRHGETAENAGGVVQGQTDVPLNENGLIQARLVGERLKNEPFDVILSSDLQRAAITARAIANGREIIYTPRLREWGLGHWQGKNIHLIQEIYPEEHHLYKTGSPDFLPEGGESRREFYERAIRFLEDTAEKYAGKKILCVTHGGFLRNIILWISGPEVCGAVPPCVGNTSISCIRKGEGDWQIVFWNDMEHLERSIESDGV